jgi:fermentation-respiration switch protein FrsA (DUF1100 family)
LLIVHGELDTLITLSQGKKLYKLAHEPKQMFVVADIGHGVVSDERSWTAIAEFFDAQLKR